MDAVLLATRAVSAAHIENSHLSKTTFFTLTQPLNRLRKHKIYLHFHIDTISSIFAQKLRQLRVSVQPVTKSLR